MKKICFAASSGGHLEQLNMLKPLMDKHDSYILTEKTNYNFETGRKTFYLYQINRSELLFIFKFLFIFIKSFFIFLREKPDFIISTGALCTIPTCIIAKLFRKKVIFIESFAKVKSQSITGKIMYKFADLFLIQWEDLYEFYPKATYGGGIY